MQRTAALAMAALFTIAACSDGGEPPAVDATSNDIDATAMCPDSDGDGVCDAVDACDGFDDGVDTDGDGFPDFCQPTLDTIDVSNGPLVPSFSPLVNEYTVDVRVEVQSVDVTPIAVVPSDVTIRVNGITTQSGGTQSVSLDLGPNVVHVHVSADDGGERTYVITINRAIGLVQQAYVKASNTGSGDRFGSYVGVDGDTLVVSAPGEESSGTGVNADQIDDTATAAGAVYVFARDGSTWTQQAYLKSSNTDPLDGFGTELAVDGDTIAVGAECEDSGATGVGADQADDTAACAGAVYVFVRNGVTWTQQAYIKPSNTGAGDRFGYSLALSGDTLAVGAWGEGSGAVGVDGDQADDSSEDAGAVYVFARSEGSWTQQAYIKASNTDSGDLFGSAVALDGNTLAVAAPREDSGATGVDGDQGDEVGNTGAVYVFVRWGTTWTQQAYIKASNTGMGDELGRSLSLDGSTLAVGAWHEDSSATGIDGNELDDAAGEAGAVYVFERTGTTWVQQAYVKASNTGAHDNFGLAVAVGGDRLAVGASQEQSGATGVGGIQSDDSADFAGAVYVFERNGVSWAQQAYVKASNTDAADRFGIGVALSGDTLAVGAGYEESSALGIDGDQTDNDASAAGAVYLYVEQP